jgi:hypothetical protein
VVSLLEVSIVVIQLVLFPFVTHYWAKWDVDTYERASGKRFSEQRRQKLFNEFKFHSVLEDGVFILGQLFMLILTVVV